MTRFLDHPSVRVAVEYDGLIAAARRSQKVKQAGELEIFGGGIEASETPIQAAYREVLQETNQQVDFVNNVPIDAGSYELPIDFNTISRIHVCAFLAVAQDTDFTLNPEELIPDSLVWLPYEELLAQKDLTKASRLALTGLRAVI